MRSKVVTAVFILLLVSGCATRPEPEPTAAGSLTEAQRQSPDGRATVVVPTTRHDRLWVPPYFTSPEDEAHYYVSRLADRRFVDVYGGEEHPRTWYIAAERLGQIGEPAIPLLYARIDTEDDYELMLVLYALQLATQDPALLAATGGDYVRLTTSLDPAANAENHQLASAWWQRHGQRWQ